MIDEGIEFNESERPKSLSYRDSRADCRNNLSLHGPFSRTTREP